MADISSLGEMKPVDPIDLDSGVYKDAGPRPFPPKGEYLLQAPETFTFGRTGKGYLSAQIDAKIADGDFAGIGLKFQKVSAKTFLRKGVVASQMGDYLRACGVRGRYTDEAQQADAVEQTANTLYKAILDWRVYNKATGLTVEGMENFPKNEDGTYKPFVIDENDKDENGEPKRLRANLYVDRYIPSQD